jgi:hypothetical protein
VRPVSRPAWHPGLATVPAVLALQDVFGRYCATCERPLPEGGVVWDAAAGEALVGPADASRWRELLLLCRVCAAAAATRPPGRAAAALPDRDLTFTLAAPASIRYELRNLDVPGDDAATVERVVVRPVTPAAAETVRRFALNTPFHREDELVAPLETVEALDWRLIDRTRAWRSAERAAENLRQSPSPRDRELLAGTVAAVIEAQGCWSVWATVLWDRLLDPELLGRLLLSEHSFPATREDWLP